jgi:hypothetical protein
LTALPARFTSTWASRKGSGIILKILNINEQLVSVVEPKLAVATRAITEIGVTDQCQPCLVRDRSMQAFQLIGLLTDNLKEHLLVFVAPGDIGSEERAGKPGDRGKRGAQLMGYHRQKLALELIGFFGERSGCLLR